jgi:hypothetical protein
MIIGGLSGQTIIRSILAGERDPRKLAQLRDRRNQASEEEVARSLEGTGRKISYLNSGGPSMNTISAKSRWPNAMTNSSRVWR